MNININNTINQLFSNAPKRVINNCSVKNYFKDKVFMYENEDLKNIYLLCEGTINFTVQLENGKTLEVGRIYVNDNCHTINNKNFHIIGFLEVLSEEKYIATTVTALTDCKCIRMSVDIFKYWLESDIKLSLLLNKVIAQDFIEIMSNYTQLLLGNSYNSLIHGILEWSKNSYEENKFVIIKERQQMADELGISLRSVFRNLKILKDDGLIETSGSKIIVTEEQLKRLKNLYCSLKS